MQADNAASLSVVRVLGMRPLGAGRIWCPARNREEHYLWFDLPREAAAAAATSEHSADPSLAGGCAGW